jgi:hypothetical protein
MSVEVTEFIWKNVGVWYEIEVAFPELFLHADHIIAKSVLSSDLITLREMIDFLVLIQAFIQVALAAGRAPQDVPLMRLSVREPVAFED